MCLWFGNEMFRIFPNTNIFDGDCRSSGWNSMKIADIFNLINSVNYVWTQFDLFSHVLVLNKRVLMYKMIDRRKNQYWIRVSWSQQTYPCHWLEDFLQFLRWFSWKRNSSSYLGICVLFFMYCMYCSNPFIEFC